MKIELPIKFTQKYLAEAVVHIMNLRLWFYLASALALFLAFLCSRLMPHPFLDRVAHGSLILFLVRRVPGWALIGSAAFFVVVIIAYIIFIHVMAANVARIIFTDEGVQIEYRRLPPRAILWSAVEGSATSARLFYLEIATRGRRLKDNLVIPLSDINSEDMESIKGMIAKNRAKTT